MTIHFGARLSTAVRERGVLCVGLDPHTALLRDWGLTDDAAGALEMSLRVIEAAADAAVAVKPQSAFYERHGSAGVAALERVLGECRDAGLLSVLDVKRGDIGSTMGAYAEAYLGSSSPLAADSITVSPYLGYGSLRPAIDLARATGRGVFVLGLTSNPEGAEVQLAGDPTVVAGVLDQVRSDNAGLEPCGDVGVVVGATLPRTPLELGLDLAVTGAPVLAPGVGAQGATPQDVARTFAGLTDRLLVPISRGVLSAGPEARALRERTRRWSLDLDEALAR